MPTDLTMPKGPVGQPVLVGQPPAPTAAQPDPTIPVEIVPEVVVPVIIPVAKPQVAVKGDVEPKPFDEDRTDTATYSVVQIQGNMPAFKWQGACKQCPFVAREADKGSALNVVIAHVSNKHGV